MGNGRKPTVKICGIRDEETLRGLLTLPVDQIGFVFAKSRRQVTPEEAGSLIRIAREERGDALHRTVGVFVEPSREELTAVLAKAPVDIVQLHSEESPDDCRWIREQFGVQVYRVISLASQAKRSGKMDLRRPIQPLRAAKELLLPYQGSVDAVLLDTYDPVTIGGSGRTFPWESIPPYREAAHRLGMSLIAAGGLTIDNVRSLLDLYHPDGVDISGGVETDGVKDIQKIRTFVERVKGHEQADRIAANRKPDELS
ncbi:phosphoribosylanthranilate isomerase [Gorillibacterium sp. CAU 1737]|uniref:phosphoribosylanthranilate isomerase n=1 Tax=Gorillibacterium sp. CAU 1737 TaxID=3140362 RepID=UPI003260F7EB